MNTYDRRVYAPPPGYRAAVAMEEEEVSPRRQSVTAGVAFVVIAAASGFLWSAYSGGETPRISPPAGEYKIQPPPGAEMETSAAEESALYDALEGRGETTQVIARPGPEEPLTAEEQALAPARDAGPSVLVANGPYVAQIAAIQSERAVDESWRRLASRAPDLFSGARMDVERADLGPRGIYYRVRAGYFADRPNASRFCDRVKAMGQDCIVVAR